MACPNIDWPNMASPNNSKDQQKKRLQRENPNSGIGTIWGASGRHLEDMWGQVGPGRGKPRQSYNTIVFFGVGGHGRSFSVDETKATWTKYRK